MYKFEKYSLANFCLMTVVHEFIEHPSYSDMYIFLLCLKFG